MPTDGMLNSTTWLYGAEVLPIALRSKVMGLAAASHFIVNVASKSEIDPSSQQYCMQSDVFPQSPKQGRARLQTFTRTIITFLSHARFSSLSLLVSTSRESCSSSAGYLELTPDVPQRNQAEDIGGDCGCVW